MPVTPMTPVMLHRATMRHRNRARAFDKFDSGHCQKHSPRVEWKPQEAAALEAKLPKP